MTRYLKFWGTRGSCPVSGSDYQLFGGNTACLELRYDDHLVIFDAGTGIRPLGEMLQTNSFDLFLGHTHWDHIIGFPFFKPIHSKDTVINIWAPQGEGRTITERFDDMFSSEFFPIHLDEIQAKLAFKNMQEDNPIQIGSLKLEFHKTHHPGLTYCFKITTPHQTISYITDNEIDIPLQSSFINFHKNADIFIHEAQYSAEEYKQKAGWGHSDLPKVISLIEKIQPKNWFVTHHDPKHTDADLKNLEHHAQTLLAERKIFIPVQWISDGFILKLK
jgi:phosphoribosyl 1,2-cyclic phosphodiesterase